MRNYISFFVDSTGSNPTQIGMLTGMVGAVSAKALFALLRVDDWSVRGFALGTASHGIGAARAMQVHPDAGAYAGLALALQVLLASLWMPWLAAWWTA